MPKIAVITGAGAGVGRATAREFARQGFDVALLSRDPARLENAADEVRRHGMRALPIPTDIADAAAMEAVADRVEAELGPIDVWVNVAMATVFSPGLLDRYLAKAGYSGPLADQPVAPDAPPICSSPCRAIIRRMAVSTTRHATEAGRCSPIAARWRLSRSSRSDCPLWRIRPRNISISEPRVRQRY